MRERDKVKQTPDKHGVLYVPFTLYERPHGKKRAVQWMTRDKVIAAKADAIIASGFVFEIEHLGGDIVSVTITDRGVGDMMHMLSNNGPTLTKVINAMITDFRIAEQVERVKRILDETWHTGSDADE